MPRGRIILNEQRFHVTIDRLCHELIENYGTFEGTCIIGIQPRGILLADRICARLNELIRKPGYRYGKLDITFYRDDFRTRDEPIAGNITDIEFLVDGNRVLMIDDVLYTGRTIRAALTAIQHYGRASQIELLTLIDRRFNRHLPIQSNYSGLVVDSLDEAFVKVEWAHLNGKDQVKLFSK